MMVRSQEPSIDLRQVTLKVPARTYLSHSTVTMDGLLSNHVDPKKMLRYPTKRRGEKLYCPCCRGEVELELDGVDGSIDLCSTCGEWSSELEQQRRMSHPH